MPDRRRHRGPHPEDAELFADSQLRSLCSAAADLCWLLDRGYASPSSMKLVGDRYRLTKRQRLAVSRCSCTAQQAARRRRHELAPKAIAGAEIWIDGYNVLTSIEAALAQGVILSARDGCFRDMASMHGSYRKVAETIPALKLIGLQLSVWRAGKVLWLLDRPVSNSGRLKRIVVEFAHSMGWDWDVQLAGDPDAVLMSCAEVVASSDSQILDACGRWVNLARNTIESRIPSAHVVDLSRAE